MQQLLALVPAFGSALMIYYTYQNMKHVNACLPGIFHCEIFNFIVPRRTRLAVAIGAATALAIMALLIVMNYAEPALALSIVGIAIGLYGLALQVKHGAYCMYCITTDAILFITAAIIVTNA